MKTVGIDVGYGFTKAVASGVEPVLFPSIIGPAESLDFDAGLNGKELTLHYGDKSFFVGEQAALQSRWQGSTLDRTRVTTEEARILFLAGLAKLFPEGVGNGGLSVVTGLPIAWLKDKGKLIDDWSGLHTLSLSEGEPLHYLIKEIEVVPQAWGTLVREMITHKMQIKDRALFEGDVAVVDFGTLTVNFLAFSEREYVQPQSTSLDIGMSKVLQTLHRRILALHDLDLPLHKVDIALRQGFVKVYGEPISIDDLVEPELASIVERCLEQARSLWGDGRAKTRILLTGGGAYALGGLFKQGYGHKRMTVVNDAQMANAEGLLLWAKMKESFSNA